MAIPLRHLLVGRAARLQDRPALTSPEWGTLSYFQWRNRVEGVGLGLMAARPWRGGVFARTGTPWDWACEVAAACCGLQWDPAAPPVYEEILGGSRFNDEAGREPYHHCEDLLDAAVPFLGSLSQGQLLQRLHRFNGRLGWDHETRLILPLSALATEEGRGALWSALFAGAHAELVALPPGPPWDATPFRALFSE